MLHRPRRLRKNAAIRELVEETQLSPRNFIWPTFIVEGKDQKIPISSMPGVFRLSIDLLIKEAKELYKNGIRGIALFPSLKNSLKDRRASEATNPQGLLQRCIQELKNALPELIIFSDVAMDPYSSDGHDGLVENEKILNDETLEILAQMALSQAQAGADFVAPSDMMDGRVGFIRKALDAENFQDVGILAYTAKYASAFYGPFREALDSAPRFGDKKTYQMNPANTREALVELHLDCAEGADIVMVKPALAYLDIIHSFKQNTDRPVAAYSVSGEYAMIKFGAEKGLFEEKRMVIETHLAIKRAGADMILTYWAPLLCQILQDLP